MYQLGTELVSIIVTKNVGTWRF